MRRKREIIRQSQLAQATSLSTATNQGGAESSGFAGALSSVSGAAGRSGLATDQNQELGNAMFESNKRLADIYGTGAGWGGVASMASGLGSLGGALTKNASTIAQIGTYFTAPKPA